MTVLRIPITIVLLVSCAACGRNAYVTAPTAVVPTPVVIAIEGESASGQGDLRERSRASGGRTLHLAPGEEHTWTVNVPSASTEYSIAVIYANGQEGPNEIMTVGADGLIVATRVNRDSGDAIEGWNTFISDVFGVARFGGGIHTVFMRSQGGDGCVEIDRIVLTPM